MSSFTPIFGDIVTSSLWSEEDVVVKVFLTMMAVKDRDHVVRKSAYALAQLAHKTEAEVLEALKVLATPDTKRIEPQDHEGRRIERVDGGWLMLNGAKYQDMMFAVMRRSANADRMKRVRLREKQRGGGNERKPLKGEEEHERAARAGAGEEELEAVVEKNLPRASQAPGSEPESGEDVPFMFSPGTGPVDERLERGEA